MTRPGAFWRRHPRLMAILCGALSGLGHAPFGLWPLTILGIAGLGLLFLRAPSVRRAALVGWLGGMAGYVVSLHWIVEPFLVDIARHGVLAPFALLLLTGGLALFHAAAFGIAKRWGRGFLGGLPALWAFWSLAELARGHAFTGFPWNLPGYVWLNWAPAQLAALVGPYGLTALTLALALWPVALIARRSAAARLAAGGVALAGLAALFGAGLWVMPEQGEGGAEGAGRPLIRLVQPNAAQHLKWHPDHAPVFYARAIEATGAAPRPALIVWPETAIPALLEYAESTLAHIAETAAGVPVVAGIQRRDDAQTYYNSLIRIGPGGQIEALYDKHHLVPFGEYLPWGDRLRQYGLSGLADLYGGGYTAGPGPRVFDAAPGLRALPLICYEAVFPRDTRVVADDGASVARPDLLLQATNDAWFGRFSGPYQHLAQARFRAIEQRLPLARAANTGISAMIDPAGRVTAELGLGRAGHVDAALPAPAPAQFYARAGEVPVAAVLMLLAALTLVSRRRDRIDGAAPLA